MVRRDKNTLNLCTYLSIYKVTMYRESTYIRRGYLDLYKDILIIRSRFQLINV